MLDKVKFLKENFNDANIVKNTVFTRNVVQKTHG